jgi:hypothetical protein
VSSLMYPDCIRRLYESELNGEAIYSALLKAAKSERERYHLATLLQLETETKAWLQPFLFKHRVELTTPDIRPFITAAVALYAEKGWQGLMLGAQPIATKATADFEAIAAIGPIEDSPYLVGMVEHERAIQSWIAGELRGVGDTSLEAVISKLRHPIQRHGADT